MKLKSVLILTVLLGLMFSCIAEDPMEDPNPPVGGKSQIDLTLSMGDLITKAGVPADNYTYATPAEITVNDCVIAIFDAEGKKVFYKEASSGDLTTTDHNSDDSMAPAGKKVLTYHVDVEVPWGKDMTVVVIANSAQDYSSYTDLAGFKKAIETTTAFTNPTFDPTKLVKVGILETDITTDMTAIEVPMVQLAARVDLNLAITATDGLDVEGGQTEVSYELAGFINEMSEAAKAGNFMNNSGLTFKGYPIDVLQNENKQYLANNGYKARYQNHNPVSYDVNKGNVKLSFREDAEDQWLVQKINSRTIQWGLDLKSITIDNIMLKSDVLLDKWGTLLFSNTQLPIEENMESLTWTNPAVGQEGHIDTFAGTHFILTFYTYEKEFDKEPLTVKVNADVIRTTVSSVERYRGMYGAWYDTKSKKLVNGSGGTNVVFVILEGSEFGSLGADQEIIETEGTAYSKQFAFIINPQTGQPNYTSNTDGVIHGNLYSVAATVKSVNIDVEVDLEYAVNTWKDGGTVNLPSFN
ncbi:hypothetical protein [Parabacteroides sp. PF5-6]|uniref:hypothetical protein n=1 Tax=Parabacteroides sp. PF5-6 TaxID=1742403 RepID=UPI0024053524|nr:hypothetical protein [Parabacteroides sp. PF5-6]MDF9829902.1 hypothetical protein [Parabacteroides sp. PF5-6]